MYTHYSYYTVMILFVSFNKVLHRIIKISNTCTYQQYFILMFHVIHIGEANLSFENVGNAEAWKLRKSKTWKRRSSETQTLEDSESRKRSSKTQNLGNSESRKVGNAVARKLRILETWKLRISETQKLVSSMS